MKTTAERKAHLKEMAALKASMTPEQWKAHVSAARAEVGRKGGAAWHRIYAMQTFSRDRRLEVSKMGIAASLKARGYTPKTADSTADSSNEMPESGL